jgi:MYXO-CTERM domain-containing protein
MVTGTARAELLDLQLLDFPDIAAGFIDVVYNANTDALSVSGFALLFDDDGMGPSEDIVAGTFNISAVIDGLGNPVSGTLSVGGNVLGFGPSLLTGTLSDFGFPNGGGPLFEFLFTVTGGDLAAPYYGGVGAQVGVKLSAFPFNGSFAQSFDNLDAGEPGTGTAVADLAPLPAPGVLGLLALAGLGGRRRRID